MHGDLFDGAGLLNGSGFDVFGIPVTQFGVRQLRHGMIGVVVEVLVEHLQDFDGSA